MSILDHQGSSGSGGASALMTERLRLINGSGFLLMLAGVLVVGLSGATARPFGTVGDLTAFGLVGAHGLGWALAGSVAWSSRGARRLDLFMGALLGVLLLAHGWVGPLAHETRFNAVTLAVAFALFRATLLPSPPRWTGLVSAALVVPVTLPSVLPELSALNQQALVAESMQNATFGMLGLTTVGLATLISKVTFDLRRDASRARKLGSYELERRIGAGAMGEVYLARHALLRRPTAVKLLRPELAGVAAIARFEQEVTLTASLTHPNTVAVYDFGRTADRLFYYAMELLEGWNLEQVVQRSGPLPARRVLHLLQQVAGSLSEAHGAGLIHRDVKAANVMLCCRGGIADVVKVVDFGLAKHTDARDLSLTSPARVAGTPAYLAPEAWAGAGAADERTDLYAVGVLAYFLLVGEVPFRASGLPQLVAAHLRHAPPRPSAHAGGVPPGLDDLVIQLLSKDPADRPADGAALAEAIQGILDGIPPWTQAEARLWWDDHAPGPVGSAGDRTAATVVLPPERIAAALGEPAD